MSLREHTEFDLGVKRSILFDINFQGTNQNRSVITCPFDTRILIGNSSFPDLDLDNLKSRGCAAFTLDKNGGYR